ncbi:MAG: glycosyltransferase family 2 protein [Candidatus Omnitrophota bacterium]
MTSTVLPGVSVCFPVYNEEATVGGVLQEAHGLLSGSGIDYEIIVCDDGSSDKSGAVIDDCAGRLGRMRVIHHKANLGIRRTFEELYKEAKKDFVFLNATDGQWPTGILLEMLPLARDWDIVVAARKEKPYGPVRRFISWSFNAVPVILFGVRTFDAGAVKLVRREIIGRFPIVSVSPFSEAERLIRAARAGYRITSYTVSVSSRKTGRSHGVKPGLLLAALADIFRVAYSVYSGSDKRGDSGDGKR